MNETEKEIVYRIDNSEEEMFPRTKHPYELDEVLFIMDGFIKNVSLEQIADFVQRSPRQLRFIFLEYRPVRSDGTLDPTGSVRTAREALLTKKVSMYYIESKDLEDAG